MKKKKIHYAWFILIAACLIQAGGIGTLSNTSAIFISNICQDRNLSFVDGDFVKTFDASYDLKTDEDKIAKFGSLQDYEAFRDTGFLAEDASDADAKAAGYTSLAAYYAIAGNTEITGSYAPMYKSAVTAAVSTFTMYMMVQGLINAFLLPFAGKLISKLNIKWLVAIGTTIICATFALMSTFNAMWQWYTAGIVMGICSTLIFTLPAPILIRRWFVKKLGLAMGISMAFANLGGAVMMIVIAKFIERGTWTMGYWATAIVSFVLVVPAALLIIKPTPESAGMLPYGAEEAQASAAAGAPKGYVLTGVSSKAALRTSVFYFTALAAGLMSFVAVFTNVFSSFGEAMEMNTTQTAWIASLALYGGVFFKITIGWINDKLGLKKALSIGLIITISAFLLLIASTVVSSSSASITLIYVGAALYGAIAACTGTCIPLLVSHSFGPKDFAKIYSYVISVLAVLGAFAVTVIPRLARVGQKIQFLNDESGYAFAFAVAIVLCLIVFVCAFVSLSGGKKLLAKAAEEDAAKEPETANV